MVKDLGLRMTLKLEGGFRELVMVDAGEISAEDATGMWLTSLLKRKFTPGGLDLVEGSAEIGDFIFSKCEGDWAWRRSKRAEAGRSSGD